LNITRNTFPRIKEYYPEKEVEPIEIDNKVIWRKAGFTQGSPMSPILCNFALEFAGLSKIEGLIQYADDGVILNREKDGPDLFDNQRARMVGLTLATDNPYGYAMRFIFLGIQYDL